ncbi:hypothetical protein [Mucilaginibacter sp.]|uniref:hypothetical protein n=1 Tax=Mucilaginibacter sp. TaxID=1882438 RepID=UPI0035BC58C0
MITPQFHKLIVIFFFVLVASLIAYGVYCRRKSHSYMGTGRVTDIEQWYIKGTLSWVALFMLVLLALIDFL